MKKISKILSLLLALSMVLSLNLGVTALAEDEPTASTYTITIDNTVTDYVYTAYQIFAGDLDETDGTVLSNITWGSGVVTSKTVDQVETTLISALQAITIGDGDDAKKPFENCTTAAEVAEVLAGEANDSKLAVAFAETVAGFLADSGTASTEQTEGEGENVTTTGYKISGLAAGYYLVQNTTVPSTSGSAYTNYILWVSASSSNSITPKSSVPTVVKKVDDENDSIAASDAGNEDSEDWQDSADYDIGDAVPFKLTGTLPTNFDDYEKYTYIFHDSQDEGLTFESSSVKVYATVGDDTYVIDPSCYSVLTGKKVTDYSDAEGAEYCTFEIKFSDLKDIKGVKTTDGDNTDAYSITLTAESTIYVTYTSTLNDNAVIGKEGNDNTVYLQYSNNPNATGDGTTSTTPEDTVTVFTFEVSVHKVDSSGNPLSGADFTLYKIEANSESTTLVEVSVVTTKSTDASGTDVIKTVESETYTETTTDDQGNTGGDPVTKTVEDSKFTFSGLDAGTYVLKETTTPAGYNTIGDITFKIVATHETDDDDPELINLYITDENGTVISNYYGDGTALETVTFAVDKSTAGISTTITNYTGAELPSTGGMGTKIFYTLGGILVVCAGVLLIVKRRMRNA